MQRSGTTDAPQRTRFPASQRFWAKVDRRDEDSCWEWQGSKNAKGYARFEIGKQNGKRITVQVHRFSYEEIIGDIPDGLVLDHLCRNPSCVNPAHLEPVTCRENLLRGIGFVAVNARKTHCPAGHPLSADNTLVWRRGDGRMHRKCRECDRARHRSRGEEAA